MEKDPDNHIDQDIDPLEKRLIDIASRSRKKRRGIRNLKPKTTPNIKIDPNTVNPQELFLMVVAGVQRFTTVPAPSAADKIFANTLYVSDYLVDSLLGNYEAKQFVKDGMQYLVSSNIELAGLVRKVIDDSKKREPGRDAYRRRWEANQRSFRR